MFSEKEIQKMMDKLDLTREEAIQLLHDDAEDVSVELTAEQKAVEKEMRQADRKQETTPRKRERKPDESKRAILQQIINALEKDVEITVINPEREIEFTFLGERYRLTLSKPRKEKI